MITTYFECIEQIESFQLDFKMGQDYLKQKAIKEYELALLMPRKKKKQAKKSALLLYNIASWNPLEI